MACPHDSCELAARSELRTAFFDCSKSASRSIVLALERFDVFRCAILAASYAAVNMVVQLETYGLEARFWTARRSAQARREMIHLPGSWAPRLLPVRRPYRIVGLYWARIAGKATRSAEQALERHAYPRPASPDASLWNRSEMRF